MLTNANFASIALTAALAGCSGRAAPTTARAGDTVSVPAGSFIAGADCRLSRVEPGCDRSFFEGRRSIALEAFDIDRDPVPFGDVSGAASFERFGFAFVAYETARDYCRKRGMSLPTPEQFERVARGTDGRAETWGDEPSPCRDSAPSRACLTYEGPAGVRSLALVPQWVEGGTIRGSGTLTHAFEKSPSGSAAFRCAREAPAGERPRR